MSPVAPPEPPSITSAAHNADPYASYRVLLEHYPVLWDDVTQSYVVSRHEDITWALKNRQEITSDNYSWQIEPVHGRTILTMEGKEHTEHRRLLTPFFHGVGLETFSPAIDRSAHLLADPWLEREAAAVRAGEKERGEVDLVAEFTRHYPVSVIEEMLALPKERHADFERWYVGIMDFISNAVAGDAASREIGLTARAELTEYLIPLIQERRGSGGRDLLSLMCDAEVDGKTLTDEEVRAFVSLMITAGGETSDKALGNMFANLIQNPEQLQAVYDDPDLIIDAFAETLRFTPPSHIAARTTLVDMEIQGVHIPRGSTLTLLLAAGNRDPRKFEDPDRFDVFRTDNDTRKAFSAAADHHAFANGRHFCAGAMLARKEVPVAAALLLERMKDLRFADGFEPQGDGVFTRGIDSLRVTYVPA